MMWLARLLGGPIVDAVVGVFNKYQDRKMTEAEIRGEVEKAVLGTITEVTKSQADVIMAETRSEDWLTRNWRPIVALTSFFSYWYVIVAYPHLFAWGLMPKLGFGEAGLENLFYLTTVCVGGYVGGRTVEKVTGAIVSGRRQ